jgi:hypothetical protein
MPIKLTTWNIENSDRLVSGNPTAAMLNRRRRIADTIEEIDPDLLCVVEGPRGERDIDAFCTQVLNRHWVPIMLKQPGDDLGDRDDEYDTNGNLWIWFLARAGLESACRLQSPVVWQDFIGAKSWVVNFWGEETSTRHSHYRHPQVMIFDMGEGRSMELIGLHLKSKTNRERIERDENGDLTGEYLSEALKARIKLATEARNVRRYVDAKHNQVAQPAVAVMGDLNDGPGHDFFETQYLFFGLVSNLQGDVIVAEQFMHHALTDAPQRLRWSAKFRDDVLNIPASQNPLLLDHILVSSHLFNGDLPLMLDRRSGQVEHEAYERNNAGSNNSTKTSDHRPVSCEFVETAPG